MLLSLPMLFLLPAVLASEEHRHVNDCGNSNFCSHDQTCTATPESIVGPARKHGFKHHRNHQESHIVIGQKWGCAPAPKATMCDDARFSCPNGYKCELKSQKKLQASQKNATVGAEAALHGTCQRKEAGGSSDGSKPATVPLLQNGNSVGQLASCTC